VIKYDDLSDFLKEIRKAPGRAVLTSRGGQFFVNDREVDRETWYELMKLRVATRKGGPPPGKEASNGEEKKT